MYPSNPAQPPKPPPVNPQGREIPGVTKRPIAPMRGQAAPAVDYKQAAAMKLAQQAQSSAPAGASSMQAPARSAMLQAPGQPAPARAPMQSQAPQQAPQQSMMAKAAASMAGRQSAGPAMDLSADAAQKRQAAALALQRQQQGPVGPKTQAGLDAMFQSAMGGLTNREVAVDGREWDPSAGAWLPQGGDAALPPGVRGGDPGTYLENGTWVYDPEKAAANAIATDTARTAAGTYEDFLMPTDQRTAQEEAIQRAAAQAMRQQAQMMAARGMGGSGVEMMGLGDINANVLDAMNDMNAADRAQAIEQFLTQRGQDFGAFGQSRATGMSEEQQAIENARYDEESAYSKEQEALANTTTALNNYLGFTGSDTVSPEVYAAAMGVDLTDPEQADEFRKKLKVIDNGDGTKSVAMAEQAQAGGTDAPPSGYSGDWASLAGSPYGEDRIKEAARKALENGIDPLTDTPPAFHSLSGVGSRWDSLPDDQKLSEWARYFAGDFGGRQDGKGGYA